MATGKTPPEHSDKPAASNGGGLSNGVKHLHDTIMEQTGGLHHNDSILETPDDARKRNLLKKVRDKGA